MANKLLSEIMKDLRNGKDVKNFKFFEKAKEALLATPEFKAFAEAEKALDEAKEALERAWKAVEATPEYKAKEEAKEVYRKAKDAMWATPECKAYIITCPGVEVRPVGKFRKTRGPLSRKDIGYTGGLE